MIDLVNKSGVSLLRDVVGLPRVPEGLTADQQYQLVAEEAALVDFVKSFGHIANAGDAEALISNYAPEATWSTARGRSVGTQEIKANYDGYYGPNHWFNYWTNIVVRFVRPFDEAYIAAYHYSLAVNQALPEPFAVVSTDVWHLKRVEGSWKIFVRRIDLVESHGHRVLPPA
jgi:hypothetical protein